MINPWISCSVPSWLGMVGDLLDRPIGIPETGPYGLTQRAEGANKPTREDDLGGPTDKPACEPLAQILFCHPFASLEGRPEQREGTRTSLSI